MKKIIVVICVLLQQLITNAQLNGFDRYGNLQAGNKKPGIITQSIKKEDGSNITDTFIIAKQMITEQPKESGENYFKNTNEKAVKIYSPLKSMVVTSGYGYRVHPVTGTWKWHNGIDLKANYEPVYCIADGIVIYAGWGNLEGNYVKISHGKATSIYCHLSKLLCKTGDILKGGQVLGISGNTGRSTGPHLHFGVKKSVI